MSAEPRFQIFVTVFFALLCVGEAHILARDGSIRDLVVLFSPS